MSVTFFATLPGHQQAVLVDEANVFLIRGDEFGLAIGSITYKMPNSQKALSKRTLTVDQASVNEIYDRFFVGSEPSRTRSSVLIDSLLANHCKQAWQIGIGAT